MGRIIGIDLGTTNSCVAVLDERGATKVLSSDLLELPSVPGVFLYKSPEQCQDGLHVEPASDRYALATLLFEAVAGRPPFVSSNPRMLMQLHKSAPVPPLRSRSPRPSRPASQPPPRT